MVIVVMLVLLLCFEMHVFAGRGLRAVTSASRRQFQS